MKAPFNVFTRTGTDGKKYFSARFFDSAGRVLRTVTLPKEINSKVKAVREAERLYNKGVVSQEANPLVYAYLESFWKADSEYAQGKALRGAPLSASYLRLNAAAIRRARKYFDGKRCLDVTPSILERMIQGLSKDGLNPRLVNISLQSVTVPLNYFYRVHGLPNPIRAVVTRIRERPRERGSLTFQELQKLIALDDVLPQVRAGVLLGSLCGLRIGEALGVRLDDIDYEAGIINIRHSYNLMEGLKAPKWDSVRQVPAPDIVLDALRECIATAPRETPYILWNRRRADRPAGRDTLQSGFISMLSRIGVDVEEREKRHLSFHALRHSFVSLSRVAGVPGFIIQRIAGHKSMEMTDNYSHASIIDFQNAREAMSAALKKAEGAER